MPTDPTLLPPNATKLERGLEVATSRLAAVPMPLAPLWDPETCPEPLLPWLAWGLSVDRWDADWPVARKRAEVAASIQFHRMKGTPAAVDSVLAGFDELLEILEWHEATPPGEPHTFDVVLPLVVDGAAPGGPRSRAALAEAVVRDVTRVKRLSQHFRFVQRLDLESALTTVAAAHFVDFDRYMGEAEPDLSPVWLDYLQTENGEPIQDQQANFLEDVG